MRRVAPCTDPKRKLGRFESKAYCSQELQERRATPTELPRSCFVTAWSVYIVQKQPHEIPSCRVWEPGLVVVVY